MIRMIRMISLAPYIGLYMVFLVGLAYISTCTNSGCGKEPTVNAVRAFIDCESPNVVQMVVDLVPVAKAALLSLVGQDGKIDFEKLKHGLAMLKTDLAKCAMAAAAAGLDRGTLTSTKPSENQPLTLIPQEPPPEPIHFSEAFTAARVQLGWGPIKVAGTSL